MSLHRKYEQYLSELPSYLGDFLFGSTENVERSIILYKYPNSSGRIRKGGSGWLSIWLFLLSIYLSMYYHTPNLLYLLYVVQIEKLTVHLEENGK